MTPMYRQHTTYSLVWVVAPLPGHPTGRYAQSPRLRADGRAQCSDRGGGSHLSSLLSSLVSSLISPLSLPRPVSPLSRLSALLSLSALRLSSLLVSPLCTAALHGIGVALWVLHALGLLPPIQQPSRVRVLRQHATRHTTCIDTTVFLLLYHPFAAFARC